MSSRNALSTRNTGQVREIGVCLQSSIVCCTFSLQYFVGKSCMSGFCQVQRHLAVKPETNMNLSKILPDWLFPYNIREGISTSTHLELINKHLYKAVYHFWIQVNCNKQEIFSWRVVLLKTLTLNTTASFSFQLSCQGSENISCLTWCCYTNMVFLVEKGIMNIKTHKGGWKRL